MFRSLILSLTLMILTAACNLSTQEAAVPTSSPTPLSLPAATRTESPAATTVNPTETPAPTITGCTPRADWTVSYTVIAGDTLGSIAQRSGSTVTELAGGNCLSDPNTISVGLVLRVPRAVTAALPPTATFAPPFSQNPPVQQGTISLSSSISGDAGHLSLLRGDTITVIWDGAPTDAAKVSFWLFPYGWTLERSGTSEPPIGEDLSPANGASIQWKVPGSIGHQLVAFAYRANGSLQAYSFPVAVSSAPVAGQGCEVAPATTNIIIYTEPHASSTVFGTLEPGNYVEVLGRSLNGWYAFDPGVAQAGNTGVARLRWLPVDSSLVGRGNCVSDIPTAGATRTYVNNAVGIALDIPANWTQVDGPGYVDFFGPGDGMSFEIILGQAGTNQPIEEVAAECKQAEVCIGSRRILSEGLVTLPSGMVGYQLELTAAVTKPDTLPGFYVFFLVSGRNIVVRGFNSTPGFFAPVLNTLRPA
ncbi:MAG: LysM peptidoglycan-binding domain-containing protein [Anaerolineaceae bacterium]|nr:LysM peptidoglycan-binding domain-containing protein [Anaerolineaceae bacterium]